MSLVKPPVVLKNWFGGWPLSLWNYLVEVAAAVNAGSPGSVQHLVIDIPFATIHAQTSGVAFAIGAVLPANTRLLALEVDVIQEVSGAAMLTNVNASIQGPAGTDIEGTLLSDLDVFNSGLGFFAGGGGGGQGLNPYMSRGGQQLFMTLDTMGDTLANCTQGHLVVHLYYAVIP